MKVYIWPEFGGKDEGDGGVRRVVELQRCHLPRIGIEVIDNPADADVLAAHITMPDTFLARFHDKPLVMHCHGLYWGEYNWEHNWYFKANAQVMEAIRQADAVTAPSEWVAQAIRRHTLRDVDVINHGVDIEDWKSGPGSGYVLWNKNRIDPICDSEPVNVLARMMPDVKFVTTFGDESVPNVIVTGSVSYDKAKALVEEAGVYLCTTRETFGIGTLEALAAGVPIVGWAWGGQREFLRHGEESWLVTPGDFDGLVKGIQWALENRKKISPKARQLASEFSSEKAAREYGRVYERALAGARASAKQPKTSIIVTAYKLEDFLKECLESIAAQTADNWECIVVDDASPDGCGKIADEFAEKDSRFRVIHNETNQYLPSARNIGIAAARGKYILPLDADDLIAPATVGLLSHALDEDRSIHIAYGNVEFMDPGGRLWHSGWPVDFKCEWQLSPPPEGGRSPNLLPYSSMYRKTVWEQTGGYRIRCRTAEDADFWCRAASYGFRPKMVTQADTLRYRNRNDSMSRVEPAWDWTAWFPWAGEKSLSPAGILTNEQMPVPSLDPPQVSIIIPVGPGHQGLMWDALDSVASQTFRNWECIVVNDTGEELPKLPSWARLVEVGGKVPLGVGTARNRGLEAARAFLFVPLDADDFLEPQYLESVMAVEEEHGGIVYTDWYDDFGEEGIRVLETPDYKPQLLISNGCLHAVTALYPRSLWKQIGGFQEGQAVGWEDWDFQLSAAAKGICSRRVATPLWTYRKYSGQRREETQVAFDQAKKQILSKWSEYWEGDKELMACGGCRQGRATTQPQSRGRIAKGSVPASVPDQEAVLVRYIGEKEGAVTFRGTKGAIYRFSKVDSLKYVLTDDAEMFKNRLDFGFVETPGAEGLPEGKRLKAKGTGQKEIVSV